MFRIVVAAEGADLSYRITGAFQKAAGTLYSSLNDILLQCHMKIIFVNVLQIGCADAEGRGKFIGALGKVDLLFHQFPDLLKGVLILLLSVIIDQGKAVQIAKFVEKRPQLLVQDLFMVVSDFKKLDKQGGCHICDSVRIRKVYGGLEGNPQIFKKVVVGIKVKMDPVVIEFAVCLAVDLRRPLFIKKEGVLRYQLVGTMQTDLCGTTQKQKQIIAGTVRTTYINPARMDAPVP